MPDHNSPTQPFDDSSWPPPPHGSDPGTAPIDVQIGPYRVLEKLGEGGFGIVYLADQREPVRRRVALKVLKAGMDSAEVIARFETERQALALMDHPGIAKIFDAGMTTQGRPYFAMEYVQGVPITDYCDSARLGTPERLKLFIEACRAVQHAHQRGIIHRDLKPSNVLVALVDNAPVVKVIDFGIAKALTQRLTGSTVHTQAGLMIGTPEYMSPEQAGTGGLDADTRTDVYSLGVMLYELLTGLLPFDPGQLRKAGFAEIARIIRDVDPPNPSTRLSIVAQRAASEEIAHRRRTSTDGLRRVVRGELDWITMKALDKDRTRRYESPSALAGDVERYLAEEPVLASPPSATYRARKFIRKHRFGVSIAAAFLLLLTGGLVTTSVLYRRADQQRAIAETARADAGRESAKSRAALEFVAGMFGAVDPNTAQGREITVREILDTAAGRVGDELKDQPSVEASVREILGEAYHVLGKTTEAEREFRRTLALLDSTVGPSDKESLQTAHNLGAALLSSGKFAEARTLLERAVAGRRALYGEANADTLASLSMLAFAYQRNDDAASAERTVREALAGQEKLLGQGARDTIDTRNSLADLLDQQGRLKDAAAVAEENSRLAIQYLGDTDTKTLEAKSIHASILRTLGNLDAAERIARDVVTSKDRIFGPEHPDALISQSMLAQILHEQGKNTDAEAIRRQVVDRATRTLGPDHPTTLSYQNNLAQLLHATARLEEAERIYRAVLDTRRRVVGPGNRDTLISMNNLGLLILDEHRPEEAYPYLSGTLDGLRKALPPDHWMIGCSCGYVADCLAAMNQPNQAEKLYTEGYDIIIKSLGPDHDRARKHAASFSAFYEKQGNAAKAAEWKARSLLPDKK